MKLFPRSVFAAALAGLGLAVAGSGCSLLPSNDGASGNKSCQTTTCGNGASLQVCTSTDASGACSGVDYEVGGRTFSCNSCTDCTQAATDATQACLGAAGGDDGGTSSGDDGGGNQGHGPGTTCSARQACGTHGATYQECTTTDADGQCTDIAYQTSDGKTFACSGCACTGAAQQLAQYCGNQGTPQTTCTSATSCGTTGVTYEECTTAVNGVCQSIAYQTSDGHTYACNSCSDCSAAMTTLDDYCAALDPVTSCGGSTTCGSQGVTYQQCETSANGTCQTIYYQTSTGYTYTCNSCSDCSTAQSDIDSYCASMTGGTTCGSSTCSSGDLCCDCSGTLECLSSSSGAYTCSSYGCQ